MILQRVKIGIGLNGQPAIFEKRAVFVSEKARIL